MKKILFSIFTLFAFTSAFAQPVLFHEPLSPRIANYDIDVKLDAKNRQLHGQEVLKWFNKSADVIHELQFHLYMNAFRNNRSTFMRESGGSLRGMKMDAGGWGYIRVNKIEFSAGQDVSNQMQFIHPDDDNAEDKTVFRIPTPKPIAPRESLMVTIDFEEQLPQPPFARTGAKEEYFFVGQWFPKVGVYIDGKWNCHQFHATSEFFADFGVYNVHMTVPEKNIVGATGLEAEVKNNGDGTATHFYHAEDVHDFAWTTSPEFVEFTGKAADVNIRVLMQPDHAYQGPRHVEAAKTAVQHFHDWYGLYPFPNLTVVDPRRGAGGSGGMEYPTLITAGTAYGIPENVRAVEMVIIHEFGHNYWYHLLASNEFEESWMDEGINTYTEAQIMNDAYGPTGDILNCFGIELNDLQFQRGEYLFGPDLDPTVRRAWEYYSTASYGINSYMKPGVLLTTLQNYLGKETMLRIMRAYVERWRFKHPHTKDFIDVANDVSGQDLSWFFNQALFSNAKLDYCVDKVTSEKASNGRGFDFSLGIGDSIKGKESKDEDTTKMYLSEVDIRRLGTFTFPVEVEVVFENGEKVRERWDGQELWKKYKYTKPSRLLSATVDPDHKIVLDVNYTNNSKTMENQALGVNKQAARFLFWIQFLLDQPDVLNFLSILGNI
jgi:hypothetical protein